MIGLNITNWMNQAFTTIGRPRWTLVLNVLGTFVVVIPLALLGKMLNGYFGILRGICLGQFLVGLAEIGLSQRRMKPDSKPERMDNPLRKNGTERPI